MVALGIGHRARRLAEHVIGMAIAVPLGLARAVERLLDRAPHDELTGEDAHRRGHRLTPYRLARACDQATQGIADIILIFGAQQPPGQHQSPGRGIDEQRAGMAEMAVPIGGGDLVADQLVDGLGVRDAQQRLGEAHQRDAFGRGQRVFVQEGVEPAFAEPFAAHSVDEPARRGGDALARFEGHVGGGEEGRVDGRLIEPVRVADRGAQPRFRGQGSGEDEIHLRLD